MGGGFDAGVQAGGLRNGYEVNILIGYLLLVAKEPLSAKELEEICLPDGLANYFELKESVADLLRLEQVEELMLFENTCYCLTKKGEHRTQVLQGELPKTVREKGLNRTMALLSRKKESSNCSVNTLQTADGYQVVLMIPDTGTNLLELSLFVPDKKSASEIIAHFQENPQKLYRSIWSSLTGSDTE